MDKTAPTKESTDQLREAIRKLEAYSLKADKAAGASSVAKTMALVRSKFSTNFNFSPKKPHSHQRHPPGKDEVLRAVELVNSKRLFIETLKKGNPTEQELAESFTKSIAAYNASCDKRIQSCIGSNGIARFFSLDTKDAKEVPPKIALPQKITVQHHYPEECATRISHASTENTFASVPMSKQSAELFHMKALSLLERYGIATNPEARDLVKHSPIHASIADDDTTCTLKQTLNLFPGQTVVVMGRSALDPKTLSISSLFPETFCLTLKSTQTGFPHPSQRTGWALTHQLLPDSPQRVDLLHMVATLFSRKGQAVANLLPQSSLLKKAKTLRTYKGLCFQQHREELLNMHKTLAQSIVQAAPATLHPKDAEQTITKFFDALRSHPNPFEWLTETYHLLRECFIVKPHQTLLEAILRGKSTDLGSKFPLTRYHEAKRVLDQAFDAAVNEITQHTGSAKLTNEKIKFAFIHCMGTLLGHASKAIILQYLSEDLVYPPPSLTPFENAVQAAAYTHLYDFLNELEMTLGPDYAHSQQAIFEILKKEISTDIRLFQNNEPLVITQELSSYFQQRYESLSSI